MRTTMLFRAPVEEPTLWVHADGTRRWVDSSGRLHRLDGPAVVRPDGTRIWRHEGVKHRHDGPAVIHPDGRVEFWLAGRQVRPDEFGEADGC